MCDRDTAEVPVPILDLDLSISENYCFHFLPLFTWDTRCKTVEMENCKRKKKVQKKKNPQNIRIISDERSRNLFSSVSSCPLCK